MIKIGIIGGTGCGGFSLEHVTQIKDRETLTPASTNTIWGEPSDNLTTGTLHGVPVVLLGRHGPGHKFSPTNVPYKANIQALKDQGCTHVIATTACGSLNEDMAPGDIVLPDQFIDWTTKRSSTFFDAADPPDNSLAGENASFSRVTHLPMADPFCLKTNRVLAECCRDLKHVLKHHESGTMITIEGPRFSTRAESKMFKLLGGDLINMTTSPEAPLAKEAGLLYATVAAVTDYDSWRTEGEEVTVEAVLKIAKENQNKVFKLISKAIQKIAAEKWEETVEKLSEEIKNSQI